MKKRHIVIAEQINGTYFQGEALLIKGDYVMDDSTAISGVDPNTSEFLFRLTVCIPGNSPSKGCFWVKDWSENEGIPESLMEEGIIEFTGRETSTGFAVAREARLVEPLKL